MHARYGDRIRVRARRSSYVLALRQGAPVPAPADRKSAGAGGNCDSLAVPVSSRGCWHVAFVAAVGVAVWDCGVSSLALTRSGGGSATATATPGRVSARLTDRLHDSCASPAWKHETGARLPESTPLRAGVGGRPGNTKPVACVTASAGLPAAGAPPTVANYCPSRALARSSAVLPVSILLILTDCFLFGCCRGPWWWSAGLVRTALD
jgi:hypothetical protein